MFKWIRVGYPLSTAPTSHFERAPTSRLSGAQNAFMHRDVGSRGGHEEGGPGIFSTGSGWSMKNKTCMV